jgi:hypothetical protein
LRLANLIHREHMTAPVTHSNNVKLITGSLLGAIAAIFQSAGLFGGVGYIFSIMATGPIVLATLTSLRIGFLTYMVTGLLLMIIQPSEVLIFLFTTGLLGVSLGAGFRKAKRQTTVTFIGGLALATGIMAMLYVFRFPVLGPGVSTTINAGVPAAIFVFSIFYSFIWMRVSMIGMKYLNRIIVRNTVLEKN